MSLMPQPLRQRLTVAAVIVSVHALGVLAMMTTRYVIESAPQPISVSLLAAPVVAEETASPVMPQWKPVSLPAVVAPDVVTDGTTAEAPIPVAITVAAIASPAETVPVLPVQAPFVEARFDANYLNNPDPIYPKVSRRLREEGVVVLKVRVSVEGESQAVVVYHSSGSPRLDAAALVAVQHWQFVPAKRGAQPVESWVFVPIEFQLTA